MTECEKVGRARLMAAMRLSERTYCEKFPCATGEIHYTRDYLQCMKRLLKQSRRPASRRRGSIGKYVAAAAIAIAMLSTSVLSVSAIREPVIEFLTKTYEKCIEFFFDEEVIANAPSSIETAYTLGYVPQGYEPLQFRCRTYSSTSKTRDANGNRILFRQSTFEGSLTWDNEDSNYEILYVDDLKIFHITKHNDKAFLWNTDEYKFQLSVPADLSWEECLRLIRSVTIAENVS